MFLTHCFALTKVSVNACSTFFDDKKSKHFNVPGLFLKNLRDSQGLGIVLSLSDSDYKSGSTQDLNWIVHILVCEKRSFFRIFLRKHKLK